MSVGADLLYVVDADDNSLATLVQDGQFLGKFALVDGGRRHCVRSMHCGSQNSPRTSGTQVEKSTPAPPIAAPSACISAYRAYKHAHVSKLRAHAARGGRPASWRRCQLLINSYKIFL